MSSKWTKGRKAISKLIVQDVEKDFDQKVKSYQSSAERIQDKTFDSLSVHWTGESKRKSYVKTEKKRKSWLFRFGVSLSDIPYAIFWYKGWGTNQSKGERPVFRLAAKTFAKKVLKVDKFPDKNID